MIKLYNINCLVHGEATPNFCSAAIIPNLEGTGGFPPIASILDAIRMRPTSTSPPESTIEVILNFVQLFRELGSNSADFPVKLNLCAAAIQEAIHENSRRAQSGPA